MPQGFIALDPQGPLVRTMDGRNVVFCERVIYITLKGVPLSIPTKATSDGRSSPRLTWPIVPPFGGGWLAWAFHDAGYRDVLEILCGGEDWEPVHLTKEQCDDLLKELMLFLKCSEEDIFVTFEAVEKFGLDSFNEDRALWPKPKE